MPRRLHEAAETGDLPALLREIEQGAWLDQSFRGWTPLQTAAFYGHSEIVNALLRAGADPSWPVSGHEFEGCSAAEVARLRGHTAISQVLEDSMLPRLLTIQAQQETPGNLRLTCITVAGTVAASLLWDEYARMDSLLPAVLQAVRMAGFAGLREPLGSWNLRLLKPGPEGQQLELGRRAPRLAEQLGRPQEPWQELWREDVPGTGDGVSVTWPGGERPFVTFRGPGVGGAQVVFSQRGEEISWTVTTTGVAAAA